MLLSKFIITLHNIKNIAYHITEVLIFYADTLIWWWAIGHFQKFACVKYTCFTVCHIKSPDRLWHYYQPVVLVGKFYKQLILPLTMRSTRDVLT